MAPDYRLTYLIFSVTVCWYKSSVKPQAANAKAKAKALNMGSDQVISLRHDLWMSEFTLLRMRRYILTKKIKKYSKCRFEHLTFPSVDKSPSRLSNGDMQTTGTFQLDKMKSSDLGVFGKKLQQGFNWRVHYPTNTSLPGSVWQLGPLHLTAKGPNGSSTNCLLDNGHIRETRLP